MNSKHYILSFFLFIFIIVLNYCVFNYDVNSMSKEELCECHNNINWNSLKINNHVSGIWRYELEIKTNKLHEPFNEDTYEFIFLNDSKLMVYKNSKIDKTANWKIKNVDGTYIMYTEPYIKEVNGRILFCKDKLIFENISEGKNKYYFSKNKHKDYSYHIN